MNPLTWEKLDKMFEEVPMMKASKVMKTEVDAAARSFGIQLPKDYVDFVCRYGGATVGPYSIYGLRAAETMGQNDASAFEVTKRFQAKGWEVISDALVISADHAGNPVYLQANGEVWITDHDFGENVKIADSFEDYIVSKCLNCQ